VDVSDLGSYQYASPIVHIVADATTPHGIGTYAIDDEGVPAQATDLIRGGVVVGFLTNRESAAQIGQESSGAARGALWEAPPLVRMTNINLVPGEHSLQALFDMTDSGLYLVAPRTWSIGPDRRNYYTASQAAYGIAGGKLERLFRGASLQGDPNDLWRKCDAIGSSPKLFGAPTCGKGEMMQPMPVGHAAPPARFSDVKVRCLL
jgi:TldD protein